jgi:hypothetical protein
VSDVRNSGVEFSVSSGAATDSHLIPRSLCQRPGTRMGVDSPNLPILVFAGSRFERSAASRGAARGGSAGKTSAAGAAGIGGRGSFQRSPLVAGQPAAEAQGKLRRAGAARIRGGGSFQRVTARRIADLIGARARWLPRRVDSQIASMQPPQAHSSRPGTAV